MQTVILTFLLACGYLIGLQAQPYFALTRTDGVRLRACPTTRCDVVTTLAKGARVEIISTEELSSLAGYGPNAWFKVNASGQEGFLYGALVTLDIKKAALNIEPYTAYAWRDEVNVRTCPSLDCDLVFRIGEGDYFEVIGETPYREKVDQLGQHAWVIVDYRGRRGFIWSGLAKEASAKLEVLRRSPVYRQPGQNLVSYLTAGATYKIRKQQTSSEVIRPLGRHFWYQVIPEKGDPVWIFGGNTDKATAPVDCQCVDYVKALLDISGPTNNATDWGEVLTGQIEVTQAEEPSLLAYEQVKQPRKGDFAVFLKTHPDVHPEFGHIGIVSDFKMENGQAYVLITGANHPLPPAYWYPGEGCYNLSDKWYLQTRDIVYYR